ncbi:putative phage abortive infection protein [Leeuwenhoekiella aestuarii]|uniref:Putative phage abortive infection protein n=1 Tax=Leeuwenhoekiella aestuarii TaxID=2249426 RepID=A0A4Q0NZ05_9FLAO|nr:putative phage abortive infection protein [Leeuwenhoekiella aestuarii]RXG16562.1 putative phage abortive infection protein [Leeuwenhoekiella aestuarii]
MTTYIIINSIFTLITLNFCFYLLYKIKTKDPNQNLPQNKSENSTTLDWKIITLLISAFGMIIFSIIAPFIFTRKSASSDFDFSLTGQIGDTIGGIMNPFVAIAGVIVTGLAFYVQYKANKQQRELFLSEQKQSNSQLQKQIDNQNRQNKIQLFESQFYEMLKLHRENVTEMRINGYDFEENGKLKKFEKTTEGRKIFVTMKTELESILSLYSKDNKLTKNGFQKCYLLFFSGLNEYERAFPEDENFIFLLKKARKQHQNPKKDIKKNSERKEFIKDVNLNFNYKPFSGHSSRLGHYFRHLYLIVKSVANSELIEDYDEKMKYLRILRAQLSNHEQILMFYNWLSDYGADWENKKHSFFTEYCMIHNLWHDILFNDEFIKERVNYLRKKEVNLRKGEMFEIG